MIQKSEAEERPRRSDRRCELMAFMASRWPAVFSDDPKPLALGAGDVVVQAAIEAGFAREDVGQAIRWHVGGMRYLRAVARYQSRRFNLDGTDAGEVSEAHRLHAYDELQRLRKLRAQRKAKAASAEVVSTEAAVTINTPAATSNDLPIADADTANALSKTITLKAPTNISPQRVQAQTNQVSVKNRNRESRVVVVQTVKRRAI
jgi:sRNA-binding protein